MQVYVTAGSLKEQNFAAAVHHMNDILEFEFTEVNCMLLTSIKNFQRQIKKSGSLQHIIHNVQYNV